MPRIDDDFLQLARERYDFGRTADAADREEAENDNRFANASDKDLGQWDDVAKRQRKRAKRPCLQWNRIPVYVQQVDNDGRQNKPRILVAPGDGGQQHTAEYLQARIRHIEYEANVDTAKDCARSQQITSGRGALRVSTEYIPGTFDQRILVDRIENQFSVVWDPASIAYDRSDADWCFVISLISADAHKRKYGKESLVNRLDFAEAIKLAPEWIGVGDNGEMVQVAEYYVKEYRTRTLCLLGSTGLPAWKDEIAGQYDELKAKGLIIQERPDQCATVKQYIINGAEILDETEWIGSTIPIVPFWGREATVDGKRRTYSLTRNAQGPQKLLNVYVSNLAEMLGKMPKNNWKAAVGSIPAQFEKDYANPNSPGAILYFQLYDSQNRQLPPPEQLYQEPPIQAIVLGINQCIDGIKAAMGIFDASLGARSNETTGIAIERRQKEADVTNYHFADNEARSNKYLGEILVEIIPKVDRSGGQYPIRTEDGKTHLVPIGAPHKDWKTGQTVIHDLKRGQYNITVSSGPSYDSQRREMYDRDATLVQAQPELIWAIGPQMFRADDTAGAEERADALERYINLKFPGLIPPKDQQGQEIPPQVQQQVVGLQQEVQKAHAFAQSLHEQLATKQPELAAQIRMKEMELAFKREELAEKSRVELAKLGSAADIVRLEQEIEVLKHEAGLRATATAQASGQAHAQQLADQQRQAAADQQQAEHEHAESMAQMAPPAAPPVQQESPSGEA